jgi:hypothetical protein
MGEDFVLLASGTALDVLCYPLVHPWPGLVLFGFADGFISSWVSSRRVVVYQVHEVAFLLEGDSWLRVCNINELRGGN